MKLRTFIFNTLAMASVSACKPPTAKFQSAGKLRVLASFLPIQSHASAIAGDLASVEQLLSRDAGPHDFQFSPADVKKLAEADLFIVNGAGLEAWLAELLKKAASPKLVVVDCAADIPLQPNPKSLEITPTHDSRGNPHLWLDPILAKAQAATILAALQKANPANSPAYASNAAAYFAQLDALDAEFHAVLDPLPNKNLVTFHDAFPYLAARYELNYVGCVSEFPEKDPPPQQLARLIDGIRASKAGVLFAENGYAPGLLNEIARQTGTCVSLIDTLEIGNGYATAYLDRMRGNLAALKAAFS